MIYPDGEVRRLPRPRRRGEDHSSRAGARGHRTTISVEISMLTPAPRLNEEEQLVELVHIARCFFFGEQ